MEVFDYHKLVAHQRKANIKNYDIKEEQENLEKEVPMYGKALFLGNITPETYVSTMEIS